MQLKIKWILKFERIVSYDKLSWPCFSQYQHIIIHFSSSRLQKSSYLFWTFEKFNRMVFIIYTLKYRCLETRKKKRSNIFGIGNRLMIPIDFRMEENEIYNQIQLPENWEKIVEFYIVNINCSPLWIVVNFRWYSSCLQN